MFYLQFKNMLKSILYICKKHLIMAYKGSKSTWGNFLIFIYQLQPKTKTLVRKFERILIKLYRHMSLLFNQTYLNEGLLPNYTHTHTHTYFFSLIENVTLNI